MISRRLILGGALAPLAAWPLSALPGATLAQAARPAAVTGAGMRVVCLGGDVAEIVHALGRGHLLVGCDDTCQYPAAAARLPRAGYVRAFSAEGVLSMRPTLVLASVAAGPATALGQLQSAGVRVVEIPEARDEAGLAGKIMAVGLALAAADAAARLNARLQADFQQLARDVAADRRRPRTLALMSGTRGVLMASGAGTAADAVIRLAGGVNAFASEGTRPLTPEAGLAAAPEALLVPSHAAQALGGPARILASPTLARTPAARAGRLIVVDSLKLLGFGPRTPEAARELFTALRAPGARTTAARTR